MIYKETGKNLSSVKDGSFLYIWNRMFVLFFCRILYTFKNVSAIIGLLQDYDKERSSGNAGQKTVYGKFLYTG